VEGSSLKVGHIDPHLHAARRYIPGPYRYPIRGDVTVGLRSLGCSEVDGVSYMAGVGECGSLTASWRPLRGHPEDSLLKS
jgi:hypothetical protein